MGTKVIAFEGLLSRFMPGVCDNLADRDHPIHSGESILAGLVRYLARQVGSTVSAGGNLWSAQQYTADGLLIHSFRPRYQRSDRLHPTS